MSHTYLAHHELESGFIITIVIITISIVIITIVGVAVIIITIIAIAVVVMIFKSLLFLLL